MISTRTSCAHVGGHSHLALISISSPAHDHRSPGHFDHRGGRRGLSTAAIVGIAIVVLLVAAGVVSLLVYFFCRRGKKVDEPGMRFLTNLQKQTVAAKPIAPPMATIAVVAKKKQNLGELVLSAEPYVKPKAFRLPPPKSDPLDKHSYIGCTSDTEPMAMKEDDTTQMDADPSQKGDGGTKKSDNPKKAELLKKKSELSKSEQPKKDDEDAENPDDTQLATV